MNKKILALLMALMMVIVSVVAFAEDSNSQVIEEETWFELSKTYSGVGRPGAVFSFTIERGEGSSDEFPDLTLQDNGSLEFDFDANLGEEETKTLTVSIPKVGGNEGEYPPNPGVYNYTLKETVGSILGIVYDETVHNVKVTVYNDGDDQEGNPEYKTTVSVRHNEDGNEVKENPQFTNEYSSGTLNVTKKIAGYSADIRDTFTIRVTFAAPVDSGLELQNNIIISTGDNSGGLSVSWDDDDPNTAVITGIGHNETVIFSNLPVGVTWKVEEDSTGNYVASYSDGENSKEGSINGDIDQADDEDTVVVTNTYDGDIDTGVETDVKPYIVLMAFVMLVAGAVVLKKRTVNE